MSHESISGKVSVVHFCNPDGPWMAGKISLCPKDAMAQGTGNMGFAGKVAAQVGDEIKLVGKWGQHPKFGRQFEVESGLVRMDESPEALIHLLASNEAFKGLGPVRARKVVDAALLVSSDGEMASALIEHPELIAERAGVDQSVVENAAKIWGDRKGFFDGLAQLGEQGWTAAQATKIIHKFGEGAAALVRGNPYMLIGKVARVAFRTADAVALKIGIPLTHPLRLTAGVAFTLDRIADNGSTWTTREALTSESIGELRPDTLDAEDLIVDCIETMIQAGSIYEDVTPEGHAFVADVELALKEIVVFDKLLIGMDFAMPKLDFYGKRSIKARLKLKAGQAAAVLAFSESRVSVMAGGAGVGKTYTMEAICEIAEENGLKVALCAPTGKAARKLEHATKRHASTIHRLLEPVMNQSTGSFSFTRNNGNPLEQDLIIVDEVSMVDVRLMHSLLVAMKPRARLLLVGDHNQIPSVGPGAILRDLLSAKETYPHAINILTEIVRQAGSLAVNTTALLSGVVAPESSAVWGIERTERGHDHSTTRLVANLVESIVTHPERLEPFGRTLDFAWDIQVLVPTWKGTLGAWAINAELQILRQRLLGNPAPEPAPEGRSPKPLVGDRIIWTKNDAELALMNGTQALVVSLPKGGSMKIRTEDGNLVEVPPAKRKHVELAYAMTIHKSQGSEWPMVILIASNKHAFMHDRNLFYTGASRAAESLTIVGDAQGIRNFANSRKSEKRQTLGGFAVRGWEPKLCDAQDVVSEYVAYTRIPF